MPIAKQNAKKIINRNINHNKLIFKAKRINNSPSVCLSCK